MEFEEEVVEFEVETVEYEEVEIPEIDFSDGSESFDEDSFDFDPGFTEEPQTVEFEEDTADDEFSFTPDLTPSSGDFVEEEFDEDTVSFSPDLTPASGDTVDEEIEEDTLELIEEPHFTDDEDENLELPNAPVLNEGTGSVNENIAADEVDTEEDFTEELEADVPIDEITEDPTLDEEQRAIIHEMQENGEYDDPLMSEMGPSSYWHAGNTMENPIEIEMNVNPDASYSEEELLSQMDMQEEGLNSMTIAEYLDNYENYQQNGRSAEGSRMQEQYHDGLVASNAYDMMQADPGLTAEEAERLAAEELKGGAALHNPDQVAGGDPTEIHAYGSGKANSAMGSMWGHGRAEDMYNQIKEATKGMTREELENTHLNIRLKPNRGE